ncbi:MAG: 2-oxoacid:acceptor oxidoreductase family protein [Anaerolineae bacterium]
MKEIRIHGRAGQGSITTARILAMAAFEDKKYGLAFPHFGAERMGAPMNAFVRLANGKIRLRTRIYEPDYVIVIDPTLLSAKDSDVLDGLKDDGAAIINCGQSPEELSLPTKARVFTVPASQIALEVMGQERANTSLLGAFAAICPEISLEAMCEGIRQNFDREDVAEKNIEAVRRAYEYVENEAQRTKGKK